MTGWEMAGLDNNLRLQSSCRHSAHRTSNRPLEGAALIVAMLHSIACQSEAVYATRHATVAARTSERTLDQAMEASQLNHACCLLMRQIAILQRIVTGFDHDIAGSEIGSLAELGLRAQTLAILLSLDDLCDAIRCGSLAPRELSAGRFGAIDGVVWFLFDSLAVINKRWLQCRPRPCDLAPYAPRASQTTVAILYRAGVRRAQRALAELRADPDLTQFLRQGSARAAAPQVRHACDRIADVLEIALIREPDPALLLAAAVLRPEELHDLVEDVDATLS